MHARWVAPALPPWWTQTTSQSLFRVRARLPPSIRWETAVMMPMTFPPMANAKAKQAKIILLMIILPILPPTEYAARIRPTIASLFQLPTLERMSLLLVRGDTMRIMSAPHPLRRRLPRISGIMKGCLPSTPFSLAPMSSPR